MARLLFVVTEDWYFWSHRRHLAQASIAAGWQVAVATRVSEHGDAIAGLGVEVIPINWKRGGLNPVFELASAAALFRAIGAWQPDVVHYVALKPVLAGLLQPRATPSVNAITGLGYIFTPGGKRPGVLKHVVKYAMRRALRRARAWTVIQNDDDAELARALLGDRAERAVTIAGAGIDLAQYQVTEPPAQGPVRFALVARMLWDKGVGELVAAAQTLRLRGVPVEVDLIGAPDPENRASIDAAQLQAWTDAGVVCWRGWCSDINAVWAQTHVAVLPSYREGLPKALIEAAACGRPMITTDVPGCRSVVQHEVNGLLVPRASSEALADAMQRLASDAAMRATLGARARALAEERYGIDAIAAAFHDVYAQAMAHTRAAS